MAPQYGVGTGGKRMTWRHVAASVLSPYRLAINIANQKADWCQEGDLLEG